ncbi:Pre-mRNA-splicing factor cef1 [Serendipita sp. 399]|nr:Pre-mRNA-splicing factor cef1 [Serendipita sp. 399]
MARTPRTGPQEDMVMAEARNLRLLTATQTPLLGEENTPLHTAEGTGFQGVTPRAQAAFTPNPLATPRASGESADPTPFRMPARDNLGINTPMSGGASFDGETPLRSGRGSVRAEKDALSAAFRSLPAPQNDFSLMLPEEADAADGGDGQESFVEDAAERDRRLKREEEERRQREFNRRSLSVQKGYPRPPNVNPILLRTRLNDTVIREEEDAAFAEAQAMINEELAKLAAHDAIAFPLPGTMNTGSTPSHYIPPDDRLIVEAKALIETEMALSLGYPHASTEKVREGIAVLAKDQDEPEDDASDSESFSSWSALRSSLSYDPSKKMWVEPSSIEPSHLVIGISQQLTAARDTMSKEATRAGKVERKLGLVLGGYQTRAESLRKKLEEGFATLVSLEGDLHSFEELKAIEGGTGPRRLEGLQEEVGRLQRREGVQQSRYRDLLDERDRIANSIAVLEEKLQEKLEDMNVDA